MQPIIGGPASLGKDSHHVIYDIDQSWQRVHTGLSLADDRAPLQQNTRSHVAQIQRWSPRIATMVLAWCCYSV